MEPAISTQLLEANQRLHALRKCQGIHASVGEARLRPSSLKLDKECEANGSVGFIESLPAHLGWESSAVANIERRRRRRQPRQAKPVAWPEQIISTPTPSAVDAELTEPPAIPASVALYSDIATAMLRKRQTAPGRVWLLLRALDKDGRGWVSVAEAQRILAESGSPLYICGKRHFRRLLQQGRGVFWERDKERIWLCALAKVAVNLDVVRLNGRMVKLPAIYVIASSGTFRAHLYSVVHGGRQGEKWHNGHFGSRTQTQQRKPIGRKTITTVTGLSRSAQAAHESRAGVKVQPNYAIGERWTEARWQDACWRWGRAAFEFTDYRGKIGAPGQKYVAWQLPNSYVSPLQVGGRGRRRKLNKRIADLRMQRGAGNGYQRQQRRYFSSGKAAVAVILERGSTGSVYWQGQENLWFSRE
ncbi:MAG: hypothetical protein GY796_36855 [Chloroflexi bacterium]|nr:hypothetical protein [Chloroflexota bacterium]